MEETPNLDRQRMKVWLITVGEPLPLPGTNDRPWRTGLLAETLAKRGHQVLWWTSTVDHFRKTVLFSDEPRIQVQAGIELQFLHGRLYKHNISINRLRNHAEIARRFRQMSRSEPRPDIVLCSFPTIELSAEAVRFAQETGTPVAIDIRDLWPDIFLDILPRWAHGGGRRVLSRLFRESETALQHANAILATSKGYLDWGLARSRRIANTFDEVFPLGYRMAIWTSDDERRLLQRLANSGADSTRILVSFVGTFGRTYDLRTVIYAARRLNEEKNHRIQFILCGTGDREREWKTLAQGVTNVAFPGWLPAGELACLLTRSTIGLAAYAEGAPQGIPNKLIEYMAAGLPVISSLEGESEQLIRSHNCGISYPAADATALAEAITEVTSAPDRCASMSAAARAVFEKQFSAATVYAAMARHLEYLVAANIATG